jgi:hypothetical protein
MSIFILMRSITFGWDKSLKSSGLDRTSSMQPAQLGINMGKIDRQILFWFELGLFPLVGSLTFSFGTNQEEACYDYVISN